MSRCYHLCFRRLQCFSIILRYRLGSDLAIALAFIKRSGFYFYQYFQLSLTEFLFVCSETMSGYLIGIAGFSYTLIENMKNRVIILAEMTADIQKWLFITCVNKIKFDSIVEFSHEEEVINHISLKDLKITTSGRFKAVPITWFFWFLLAEKILNRKRGILKHLSETYDSIKLTLL